MKEKLNNSPSLRPAAEEQRALLEQSLAYLMQFEKGEYAPFLENLADDYCGQVPKEIFSAQWSQVLQAFGAQQQVLHTAVTQEGDRTAVEITSLHILRKLITTLTYDVSGRVASFSLQLAPVDVMPQAAEGWEEQPVRVGLLEKKLHGLLTLPRGIEKPPVVILLQGSGPSNMNEQVGMGGIMPFADLAHGLAERGVATIRYDKRSYAYPADVIYAGVEAEYLDDARAAVRLALEDARVDNGRIFLLGHSEGGMIGPEVLRQNPEICGFISLAGTPRHLEDLMLEQTRKMLAQDSVLPAEQKEAQLAAVEQAVRRIKALDPLDPEDQNEMILGACAAYWRSLNAIDTPALAGQLNVPMLILQGGEDFQVLADVDYPLWQKALSGKENAVFRLYPGLNHLFMAGGVKDCIDLSVYNKPAHMDLEVIRDIADWVKGTARP